MINNIKYLITIFTLIGCSKNNKIETLDASVLLNNNQISDVTIDEAEINQCIDDTPKFCNQNLIVNCGVGYCVFVQSNKLICE